MLRINAEVAISHDLANSVYSEKLGVVGVVRFRLDDSSVPDVFRMDSVCRVFHDQLVLAVSLLLNVAGRAIAQNAEPVVGRHGSCLYAFI